jgi:pimeloyl-ACP methyl ester carboxylesterase
LHAHSVDLRMWDKKFDELSKNYRVIRFDLRGYGLSSMPVEGKDFNYAEDLKKLMDALNIPKAHLVGLSLGAITISDFMTLYPEKVLSATLASGALSPQIVPQSPVTDLKAYKISWKKIMRDISCSDCTALTGLIDDWRMWQVAHKESSKIFLGDAAKLYYKTNKVIIPVLFIVGDCDSKGSKNAIKEMAKLIPSCKMHEIRNAGHFSCMEQPEEFTQTVLNFTKKHDEQK